MLSTIVIESNNPCSPELGLSTPSNRCVKISGARMFPIPKLIAAASTNRSRLEYRVIASTRRPLTHTLANKNVVTPPRTGFGMARKTPESLPRTPKRMRKAQHQRPAVRLAQRVIAMTPLFWAKTERGVTVKRAEKKPPRPSLWRGTG